MYGQPNYYGNQYFAQPMQYRQPIQPIQPMQTPQQMEQPGFNKPLGLQGKIVDSLETVKGMDIPLDGSVSYFALADNSMIVTKQLQQDGTSKTIIYKPTTEKEEEKTTVKYITVKELDEAMKKIDNSTLKDEIKALKRQLKELAEDLKELEERKD